MSEPSSDSSTAKAAGTTPFSATTFSPSEPTPQSEHTFLSRGQLDIDPQALKHPREEATPVPEELLEFLPPQRSRSTRLLFWLAVPFLLLAVAAYFIVVSKPDSRQKPLVSTAVEINAEPWATIKEITSSTGESVLKTVEQTPVRIALPPGRYKVTLEGPDGSDKEIQVDVPGQGSNSYFVVFRKPDLMQIINGK